jgi:predicted transcriptional regulator
MRPPCELVVKLVLPAFRSLVAKELIKKHDFSQVAAARKLGTTQAAISHYIYSKRGQKMVKKLEAIPSIRSVANQIAGGIADQSLSPLEAMAKLCDLCTVLKNEELVCDMHKGLITAPANCDACRRS